MSNRLRTLLDALLSDLQHGGPAAAGRAYLSRYHFDRLVRAGADEPPARLRRRVLLEQAAYALGRGATVSDVAYASGYGSPEAFSRAFSRAYGRPPRDVVGHRRPYRLPAPNGIHFHPPCGLVLPGYDEKEKTMDLAEHLTEHDLWLTGQLLELAARVPEEVLDRPIVLSVENLDEDPGTGVRPTVRSLLDALVRNKEMWGANLSGNEYTERSDTSVEGLRRRYAEATGPYRTALRRIIDNHEWSTAFIDAVCEPPETFTYGGAVAHLLTFCAYRRTEILLALHDAGFGELGLGDPMHFSPIG